MGTDAFSEVKNSDHSFMQNIAISTALTTPSYLCRQAVGRFALTSLNKYNVLAQSSSGGDHLQRIVKIVDVHQETPPASCSGRTEITGECG
jgi:hypothetical protein